jgi:hypothetical protein
MSDQNPTADTRGDGWNRNALLFAILTSVLVAGISRAWVIASNHIPFNADEAIVALMARHINQGLLPAFFYGQAYMGSLDAILVAWGFRVLGERVEVIRLLQSLLFLGTVATTALLAGKLLHSWKAALFAGLLIAVPQVNVVLYTTVSLGGYGEMLLLGNLLLLGGYAILERIRQSGDPESWGTLVAILLWGMGAGFAFWVIGLSLVFSLPMALALAWEYSSQQEMLRGRGFAAAGIFGFILGSIPWWSAALKSGGWIAVKELFGSAIAGANTSSVLLRPLLRLVNLFVFGGTVVTGLRPPWEIRWLMFPLLPWVLIFWMVVLFHGLDSIRKRPIQLDLAVLAAVGLVLGLGFIFTPFGDDPSGRYFIPLVIPLAVFGAKLLLDILPQKTWPQAGLLSMVLVFNFGGVWQTLQKFPPGLTTQFDQVTRIDQRDLEELMAFLKDQGISRGYTNYWVAYPLAFLSREELIFIPRLPYHQDFRYTARDDRYPLYTDLVEDSEQVAYITTNNPDLDRYLREMFAEKEISWKEWTMGDYQVFYGLTKPIRVSEIGLGYTTEP